MFVRAAVSFEANTAMPLCCPTDLKLIVLSGLARLLSERAMRCCPEALFWAEILQDYAILTKPHVGSGHGWRLVARQLPWGYKDHHGAGLSCASECV